MGDEYANLKQDQDMFEILALKVTKQMHQRLKDTAYRCGISKAHLVRILLREIEMQIPAPVLEAGIKALVREHVTFESGVCEFCGRKRRKSVLDDPV